MKTYNDISTYINTKGQFNQSGATIKRIDGFPVDYYSVFGNINDLSSYAKNQKYAYEGQIVAVSENGKQTVYVLDSASDVSSTGLRRVGVLSATELCGILDYTKISDFNGKLGLSALSSISSDFGKAFIKNPETFLQDGMLYDLSVVKIPIEDYKLSVIGNALSDNTLYIVSADYIEAYGQQICNLAMNDSENDEESFLGIAATDKYVNSVSSTISQKTDSKLSTKFDLSGNNEVSGTNTFLSDIYANTIYSTQISSGSVSCDFYNVIGGTKNTLCNILDVLDNSPYVLEIALRAQEIIKYGELSGTQFDWYDPQCAKVSSVSLITKNIHDYINPSSPIELPQNFQKMKEICDQSISVLPLGSSRSSLEFRLQHLREVDSIIMNYIQNLSSEICQKIDLNVQKIQDVETQLSQLQNKVNAIETLFNGKTIIEK